MNWGMELSRMKYRIICLLSIFSAVLWGCNILNPNEDEPSKNLSGITVNKFYVEKIDNLIYSHDTSDGSPHSHYYENYTPKHDSLQERVNPYRRAVRVEIEDAESTSRYVSYVFKLFIGTDGVSYHYDDSFYLDIYDCNPPYCENASQVVFYTKNHTYMEVFTKGEFSITKPSYDRFLGNKNTDGCTLNVYKNYRLILKNEHIDMDIEFQKTFFYCGR